MLLTIVASAAVWAVVAGLCLMMGSTGWGWPEKLEWRLPPVLIASLIGASLSAAGVVYQAILRNPLAEPYLLGVSGGASLASYLWQLPALTPIVTAMGSGPAAISQQAFAFAGALVTVALVFLLSSRRGRLDPVTLVLVGVIVNIMIGAVFLLLNALLRDLAQSGGMYNFLVGGIQTNLTLQQERTAAICAGVGWVVLAYISGALNVATLSDDEAEALGLRVQRLRWMGLVVASLVSAAAVSISGPIGFIGLICPHLARLIVGNDQRRLLPVATALGASLLAVADAGSRFLMGESTVATLLPVGVLTGLMGGPFFLWLLWRQRHEAAE
jgi:iron complex transport system permease protein